MWEIKTKIGRNMENDLYSILPVDQPIITMSFIDFKYEKEIQDSGLYENILSPDVCKKEIKLNTIPIEIIDDNIETSVKEHLDLEFIRMIKEEGLKNRKNDSADEHFKENKFDINIEKMRENYVDSDEETTKHGILRHVIARINNCSNFIAAFGRIGPAHYVITNEKTNDFLFESEMSFGNHLKFYVDKELKDEDIILGRKNGVDQPGVVLIINENSINNVGEYNGKKYVKLDYTFSVNGFQPQHQYFLIKKIN